MYKLQRYIPVLIAVLFVACANIGTPDGGPYDETPPKVVRTTPEYGKTKVAPTKITLEFDENIKINGAYEKVMVSPPQVEQPEVEGIGKKVTIKLLDSLKENTTYTIDFADAIEDNNEGNPMGNYAFTFSTGDHIDSMQMSGSVLEASNLEPVKGILVGLYTVDSTETFVPTEGMSLNPDTLLRHRVFERIARTNASGKFTIKGIAPGRQYRIYALKDQNQNYVFDQKSEMIAFTDRVLTPSSKPDVRMDTIWHDSIYYDSIIHVKYTHFLPDDIVLMAFTEDGQDRYLIKTERPILKKFTMFFSAPHDSLPVIKGFNFEADTAFVIENSLKNDTITYWIKDSLVYNLDTLHLSVTYYATDTLHQLVPRTDTLSLVSKLTKERMQKQHEKELEDWAEEYRDRYKREQKALEKEEKRKAKEAEENGEPLDESDEDHEKDKKKKKKKLKDEDIIVPPLPEKFMSFKTSATTIAPNMNIDLTMPEPIAKIDTSLIRFAVKEDTVFVPAPYLIRPIKDKLMGYRIYAEWEPEKSYELRLDTGAFVNIYGQRSASSKKEIRVNSLDTYSAFFLTLQGNYPNAIIQLLDGADKVVKSLKAKDGKADFYFISPGVYYLRMIDDTNGNGKWDTGDYNSHLQPENVYYYPGAFNLRAMWEISQTWNPKATPMPQQKPEKITKQKPEKEKKRISKNAERNKNKK